MILKSSKFFNRKIHNTCKTQLFGKRTKGKREPNYKTLVTEDKI